MSPNGADRFPHSFEDPFSADDDQVVPGMAVVEGDQFTGWTCAGTLPPPKTRTEPREIYFTNSLIRGSRCTIGSAESKGTFLGLASLAPTNEDKLYCLMRACTNDAECAERALQFRSATKTYDLAAIADDYFHEGWLLTAQSLQPESSLTDGSPSQPKKILLATLHSTCTQEQLKLRPLAKWTRPMPLRVHFRNPSSNYTTKLINAFNSASKRWQAASNGQISFQLVKTPYEWDIEVEWENTKKRTGSSYTTGQTWWVSSHNHELYSTRIRIYQGSIDAVRGDVEKVCLHELGHALGILEHADDPQDIMHPDSSNGSIAGYSRCLIQWLYPSGSKDVPTVARKS